MGFCRIEAWIFIIPPAPRRKDSKRKKVRAIGGNYAISIEIFPSCASQ